jgi:hypothetical protein
MAERLVEDIDGEIDSREELHIKTEPEKAP